MANLIICADAHNLLQYHLVHSGVYTLFHAQKMNKQRY